MKIIYQVFILISLFILILTGACRIGSSGDPQITDTILIDHTGCDLSGIPEASIEKAKEVLHIAYQHTSHGSQLISGMDSLMAYPDFDGLYSWSDSGEESMLDLDDYGIPGCNDLSEGDYIDEFGVTPWVTATRNLLDNKDNDHINVIVWSWCSINGHDAQRYLDNMEILISEYPDVVFVFMTGHAEGQSEDMTVNSVHYNNTLIRDHCEENDRVLFDFADIEAYDPDGNYYWDLEMMDNLDYNGGNWAEEWIAANPTSELALLTTGEGVADYGGCGSCAHSESPATATLNCILKARAAWYLWAQIAEYF